MRARLALLLLLVLALPLHAAEPLPDVAIRTADGATVRLSDFRGRVVLLDFWATWCLPCHKELPVLERLHERYGERGLAVLAVSIDRSGLPKVRWLYDKLGLSTLPIHLDENHEASLALGVDAIPAAFLIDRDGRLAARYEGPQDWEAKEADIAALLGAD